MHEGCHSRLWKGSEAVIKAAGTLVLFCCLFQDRVSPYSSGSLGTHCVDITEIT